MGFHYEELSPEKFQQFCQALLTVAHPNVQCLPVAQPDGGRDAFVRAVKHEADYCIFQVKFERSPSNSPDEREAIEKFIESERHKVEKLVRSGAKQYYLLTNVRGSAHPEVGSIDRVNKALEKAFKIPSFCYWLMT